MTLTLWNAEAENFNDFSQPVILVKGGKVGEFGGGKSISLVGSTVIKRNPDLSEGHFLRGWFDNGGGRDVRNNISAQTGMGGGNFPSEWLSFHEAKLKNLGNGDKPDYYQLRGTITLIRNNNLTYKACAQDNCKKKVVDMQNGQYRCENCNVETANFKYRMIVGVSITLNSVDFSVVISRFPLKTFYCFFFAGIDEHCRLDIESLGHRFCWWSRKNSG